MKKKGFSKRALAIILSIAMLVSVGVPMLIAHATTDVALAVSYASGNQGDNVTVNVNVAGNTTTNTAVTTADILVTYDKTKLTYVSSAKGSIVTGLCDIYENFNTTGNLVTIKGSVVNDPGIIVSGALMTITFKINATATGTANLALSLTELTGGEDYHYMTYSTTDGVVTVLGTTNAPTASPTNLPTPSVTPTQAPTNTPTNAPTPTNTPTQAPTNTPTPSVTPTRTPTQAPTNSPTPSVTPTRTPTLAPTNTPTIVPPYSPTPAPATLPPTGAPTATPTATPAPTTINTGFEDGTVQGWYGAGLGTQTLTVDSTVFHGGSKSLKVVGRTEQYSGPGLDISGLLGNGVGQYKITAYLKLIPGTEGAATAKLRMMLRNKANPGDYLMDTAGQVSNTFAGTTDWVKFEFTYAYTTDTLKYNILCFDSLKCDFYIDDVTVTKVATGATATPVPGTTAKPGSTETTADPSMLAYVVVSISGLGALAIGRRRYKK